jgi:hypothetical protein
MLKALQYERRLDELEAQRADRLASWRSSSGTSAGRSALSSTKR